MIRAGYPSMGTWITYGLGSENQNLPAFVVIYDAHGGPFGGPSNWSSRLHAGPLIRGTVFRSSGGADHRSGNRRTAWLRSSSVRGSICWQSSTGMDRRTASPETPSFPRASRCLRTGLPYAGDARRRPSTWSAESPAVQKLYGLDNPRTEPFGRQCLMARRLIERGVRFVQLFHGGLGVQNVDTWDAHENVADNHGRHAAEVDLPIAGLLTDLKASGLIDSTLVMWHWRVRAYADSQRGSGRDHNPGAMSMWMTARRSRAAR